MMCLAGDIMSDLVAVSRVIQDHIGGPFSPFVSVPIMLRAGLEKVGSDPHCTLPEHGGMQRPLAASGQRSTLAASYVYLPTV